MKVEIGKATLYLGDSLQTMLELPDNSVDSIVTDPPYGLLFMGKKWDYDVPSVEFWEGCLRVLKPGGHLLAFAGTRTQHRMAVRIEDAGFEIRDMIAWVYGSGFPKSLDVSKAIDKAAGAVREVIGTNPKWNTAPKAMNPGGGDRQAMPAYTAPATELARQWQGWGTALKPALEPITMARKPLIGTVAENVLAHGTGALNIDGCRVGATREVPASLSKCKTPNGVFGEYGEGHPRELDPNIGRWPANLIHDGSEEVLAGFPDTGKSTGGNTGKKAAGIYGEYKGLGGGEAGFGDTGSAARFFMECKQKWQDQSQTQSNVDTAQLSLSLQSALESIVQSVAATWPSLAGIVSSDAKGHSTSVTASELESIAGACTAAMAVIASGCLPESRLEKRSLCGSLVSVAATISQTGITTITASLLRSGGYADHATSSITPTNLDRGEAVSRFNYCAKASKADRGADNIHPTVKPTDLMHYLCRLVTPPGGVVLDPFMGSGSTGKAAMLEGFRFIGSEMSPEYFEIAKARIESAQRLTQQELDL